MKVIEKIGIEDRKELIKATTGNKVVKEFKDEVLTLTGAVIYEVEEDGDVKRLISMRTKEHGFIGSTSPTVARTVSNIAGMYESSNTLEELTTDGIEVKVITGKGKSGRDYFDLEVI